MPAAAAVVAYTVTKTLLNTNKIQYTSVENVCKLIN